jgi:hypothetical protein
MSNYTYHGTTDLIALPGRSVQTYPSGLVRVERSFMCRKGDVARYRNILRVNEPMPFNDGAPAIDGLFIFPEPQEQVRDDGFVEFRVTAYGRTSTQQSAAIERGSELGVFSRTDLRLDPISTVSIPAINETYTLKFVISSDQPIETILTPPEIDNPTVLLSPFTTPVVPGIIQTGTQLREDSSGNVTFFLVYTQTIVQVILDSYSSTSFGRWLEVVIVYKAGGYSSTY